MSGYVPGLPGDAGYPGEQLDRCVRLLAAEQGRSGRLREMNDRLAGALNDALTNEFEWFVEAEAAVAANAALEDG